jgi:hypothetical protein
MSLPPTASIRYTEYKKESKMCNKFGIYSQGCQHPADRLRFATTGGWHFDAGDVWSDEKESVFCTACGRNVTRWFERRSKEISAKLEEVNDGI